MKKKAVTFAVVLALTLLTTACGGLQPESDAGYPMGSEKGGVTQNGVMSESGSGNYDYFDYTGDSMEAAGNWEESYEPEEQPEGQPEDGGTFTGEKLVYTCELSLETLAYEECVNAIKNNISAFDGIIERESESDSARNWYYEGYVKTSGTRRLNLTVRIPSGKYYEFLASLEGAGKIVSKNSYVENISKRYYETDALIRSLEIQQQRLLDMMEQAETIEDMLTIESRLSEVQYQLNAARNSLSSMDTDVAFSTVTIWVDEVMEYTPEEPVTKTNTFWDRLQNTLSDTWSFTLEMLEFLLFTVIRLIPVAVLIAVVVLIVLGCIRHGQKKARRRVQATQGNPGQPPQFSQPPQFGQQAQFGQPPQFDGQFQSGQPLQADQMSGTKQESAETLEKEENKNIERGDIE